MVDRLNETLNKMPKYNDIYKGLYISSLKKL